jgi:hypothetical protein
MNNGNSDFNYLEFEVIEHEVGCNVRAKGSLDIKLLELEEFRKYAAKRPMPPRVPWSARSLIHAFRLAHAYACDGIINSRCLISQHSQSNADRHGMGKI